MRPVPVVFLRLAFSLQLSASPESVSFFAFNRTGASVGAGNGGRRRTLPRLGSRVSARGACVLLDMHRAAAWKLYMPVSLQFVLDGLGPAGLCSCPGLAAIEDGLH